MGTEGSTDGVMVKSNDHVTTGGRLKLEHEVRRDKIFGHFVLIAKVSFEQDQFIFSNIQFKPELMFTERHGTSRRFIRSLKMTRKLQLS